MSQELLNTASKNLMLGSVLLRKSEINIIDDFVGDIEDSKFDRQTFKGVSSCRISSIVQGDEERFVYKFTYSVGVRIVDNSLDSEDNEFQKALIEADFEANYLAEAELEEDCLQIFGDLNVGYHVWPYWREYVQSSCQRAGIELIVVALYRNLQSAKEEPKK